MHEFLKKTLENMGLPPAAEIKDPVRREEFKKDYERLVGRCGRAAMCANLFLYLIEQETQRTGGRLKTPKLVFLGHNNTAEVIARFVENGWADYYLLSGPINPFLVTQDENGNTTSFMSFSADTVTLIAKKGGIPKILAPTSTYLDHIREEGQPITPDKIREVFAQIDAQYNSSPVQ